MTVARARVVVSVVVLLAMHLRCAFPLPLTRPRVVCARLTQRWHTPPVMLVLGRSDHDAVHDTDDLAA